MSNILGRVEAKKLMTIGDNKKSWDQYVVHPNGLIESSVSDKVSSKLESGVYQIFRGQKGQIFFLNKSISSDHLLSLPNMSTNIVLDDLNTFWTNTSKERYEELGLVYKRGILLYGEPGTGKSCTIIQLCQKIMEMGGIIIFSPTPSDLNEAIQQIKSIEGEERKVLVIFEEVEEMIDSSDFLSLLDGELQVSNITYIATTNYINKIPARIKNRPSRFARVIEVGKPSFEDRLVYICNKLSGKYDLKVYNEIAKATDGMVLDQIKDVIICMYVFNFTLKDAIEKNKNYEVDLEEVVVNEDLDESIENTLYHAGADV